MNRSISNIAMLFFLGVASAYGELRVPKPPCPQPSSLSDVIVGNTEQSLIQFDDEAGREWHIDYGHSLRETQDGAIPEPDWGVPATDENFGSDTLVPAIFLYKKGKRWEYLVDYGDTHEVWKYDCTYLAALSHFRSASSDVSFWTFDLTYYIEVPKN